MKIKNLLGFALVSLLLALFFGAVGHAQMIQRNYNGVGIIYANTPGVTEIGTAPTSANTWTGLQTFSGGAAFAGGTFTSVTDSGLTAGRVTFASTGGLLADDADMTFATDTLSVTKIIGTTSITDSGLTAGRVTLNSTGGLLSDDADLTFLSDTLTATKMSVTTSIAIAGGTPITSQIGTGGVVVMATSPTLVTPVLGAATGTSVALGGGQPQTLLSNYSTTSQSISATTRTYLTGSQITVPTAKLQIGTIIRWRFNMTKTAAGSATSTVDIAIGTNGTTGDSAIVSFTKPAGTAAADEAYCEVEMIVRGPLSASGIIVGEFIMTHNLASTGHAVIPVVVVNTVSSTFDVTTAGLKVGLCLTTGASDAVTIQQITAQSINL